MRCGGDAAAAAGVRLVALDLDGTLTQHRSPLEDENRRALDKLGARYRLVMVGAGACLRIHRQMGGYPVDIIGNYGMEIARWRPEAGALVLCERMRLTPDRDAILEKAEGFRRRFGFEDFAGESVEFHDSGMVTFPLLGTKAEIGDKLAFDPDRTRRRALYGEVVPLFCEYTVFIGGSSSYDLVPAPYDKRYALGKYCALAGFDPGSALYFGDDWERGGGDSHLFESEIRFVQVGDYRDFGKAAAFLLA